MVDALQGHGSLPPRAVAITFDDGWLSQYVHAVPILQQMHFTATFFIITKQVGLGSMYMGVDELKTLQRDGMTLASHTRTHPDLEKVSDAQLRAEVVGSRQDLQQMLGVTPDLFAYPYGAVNKRVEDAVVGAGYRGARALGGGASNDSGDRFALHSVLATGDMAAFERDLSGPVITSAPPLESRANGTGLSRLPSSPGINARHTPSKVARRSSSVISVSPASRIWTSAYTGPARRAQMT